MQKLNNAKWVLYLFPNRPLRLSCLACWSCAMATWCASTPSSRSRPSLGPSTTALPKHQPTPSWRVSLWACWIVQEWTAPLYCPSIQTQRCFRACKSGTVVQPGQVVQNRNEMISLVSLFPLTIILYYVWQIPSAVSSSES